MTQYFLVLFVLESGEDAMARKRRLTSDSEGEEDDVETQDKDDVESSRPKKKRVSSAKDGDNTEDMEEDGFNCSQMPDFTVSSVSQCCFARCCF